MDEYIQYPTRAAVNKYSRTPLSNPDNRGGNGNIIFALHTYEQLIITKMPHNPPIFVTIEGASLLSLSKSDKYVVCEFWSLALM